MPEVKKALVLGEGIGGGEPHKVRRIVTGHDATGKAIVAMDATPPMFDLPSAPGTFFFEIWKTKSIPASIDNGPDPALGPRKLSPDPGGCAVRIVQIPPEGVGKPAPTREQIETHFHETGSPEAGTHDAHAPHPFMHRTETVDFGILIEGQLTLVLDDSEVQLFPGNIVVQRGTNHAWANRGTTPCRIAFILLDGEYSGPVRESLNLRKLTTQGGKA